MGGEIDISFKNKILTIKDTGIGIQEEKSKNILIGITEQPQNKVVLE